MNAEKPDLSNIRQVLRRIGIKFQVAAARADPCRDAGRALAFEHERIGRSVRGDGEFAGIIIPMAAIEHFHIFNHIAGITFRAGAGAFHRFVF